MKTLRLAVWSGPRNISTAMMRCWENRPDTKVVDEPLYAHYLQQTGINHPMRELIIQSQALDWQEIADELTAETTQPAIYYQKHISTHLLDDMGMEWCLALNNCMLIRDPVRMVASYAKKRTDINERDFGYTEQLRLFEFLQQRNGRAPMVIDTDRFLKDPQAMLGQWCQHLAVEFLPDMLSWPAGRRKSDGIWAEHWYDAVEKSTGFVPYQASDITLQGDLRRIADACQPAYQKMLEAALE